MHRIRITKCIVNEVFGVLPRRTRPRNPNLLLNLILNFLLANKINSKMKQNAFYTLLILLAGFVFLSQSCKKEDPPEAAITGVSITSPIVTVGVVDETAKTITISVPYGTDLSNVKGSIVATSGATITPNLASGVDFSSGSVVFTVVNGATTTTYTANVVVGANPLRIALVGPWASLSAISDNEIKTAYEWAIATYKEKAGYFSFDNLKAADLATAKAVWFHHTVFPNPGPDAIFPSSALGNAKTVIADFYKAGGNLLLTGLSGSYLAQVGRITADLGPTNLDIGGDAYITNPDDWGISYVDVTDANDYPTNNDQFYLFKNLTPKSVTFDGHTYNAFMLSDAGAKKNRAHIWDFNKFHPELGGGDVAPNARKGAWETDANASVRASFEWDPSLNGVELGAIVEFKPTATFKGTGLVIGLGAYEWYQEDGQPNAWAGNVSGITKNALDNFIN